MTDLPHAAEMQVFWVDLLYEDPQQEGSRLSVTGGQRQAVAFGAKPDDHQVWWNLAPVSFPVPPMRILQAIRDEVSVSGCRLPPGIVERPIPTRILQAIRAEIEVRLGPGPWDAPRLLGTWPAVADVGRTLTFRPRSIAVQFQVPDPRRTAEAAGGDLIERVAEAICDDTQLSAVYAGLPDGPGGDFADIGLLETKTDYRRIARKVIGLVREAGP